VSSKYIGCDLGGTNLRAGIVNSDDGQVPHLISTPTLAREGHNAVMARMGALIEDVIAASSLSKSEIGGIGIGAPGLLDLERGLTLFLPNLSGTWPEVPLGKRLQIIQVYLWLCSTMSAQSPLESGNLGPDRVLILWLALPSVLASVVD